MLKRDIALELAGHGLFVFPLREKGRTPAIKGWKERATTDPAKVTELWSSAFSGEPRDLNIGVATEPSGLLVLDIDTKDGKKGDETLAAIEREHGALAGTLRVRTPSGGIHIYLKSPIVGSSVERVGKGIDVRSRGGYVVGPGSEVEQGIYEILED